MSLWLAPDPLVLASRSVARRAVLEAAGIPVEPHPADIDERGLEKNAALQAPAAVAALLAREKAAVVAALHPGRLVLGADQTLALGSRRFAKPGDLAAARAQLSRCVAVRTNSTRRSRLFRDTTVVFEYVDTARLTMRAFSDKFLDFYLDTVGQAATASVGAYQMEGPGIQLFERIRRRLFHHPGFAADGDARFLRRYGCLAA